MTEATDDTATTAGTPTPEDPQTQPAAEAPNKREAKYRRELRETQAERDALRATVDTLHRAEAERLSGLAKPAAIWAAGTTLADLLDNDGNIDPDKVKAAAETAADALGAAPAASTPRPDPSQASASDHQASPTFADAFSPKQ